MESLFELITSVENVVEIQNNISETDVISLDIETTGLDFKDNDILLIQFRINKKTYIIDVRELPDRITKYILELMLSSGKPIIAHNAKFDLKFIYEKFGILFKNVYDTMIAEYLLLEATERWNSLKDIVFKYIGDVLDKEITEKFIDAEEITQEMLIYASKDVSYLKEIREIQLDVIKEKKLEKTLKLEMVLLPVVIIMETNGVKIDAKKWESLYEEALVTSNRLEKEISKKFWKDFKENRINDKEFENLKEVLDYYKITYKNTKTEAKRLKNIPIDDLEIVGKEFREKFNLASPRQLKTAFQIMGIGIESTAKDVLKSIKDKAPVAEDILEFRKAYKRTTTYGVDFLEHVREDGRIYATFNQIGTATGRFSSSKPNLQNIIRNEDYRSCFVAPEGKKIITADYSQQEFRLAGELSKDQKIIEAYQKGKDMHVATASVIYDVPLEEVTKEQRSNGKTVNFAVMYGSSAWGLARNMGISEEKAEEFLEKFHTGFPRLSLFHSKVNETVWENRYSVTPIGRRRGFKRDKPPQTTSEYFKFRGSLEREGFNHIIQGGSADMVKYALIMLYEDNPWDDKFKTIMTVHDEIVVEVAEEIADKARTFIEDTMIKAGDMFMSEIPSKVDAKVADHWSK